MDRIEPGSGVSRRAMLSGIAGGLAVAGGTHAAAAPGPAGGSVAAIDDLLTWNLSRPKPALPASFFWTWDHSTNWVLDDPGLQNNGCYNRYFKRPETFVEDYRRLTDLAAGLGIKGITIAGFLRDSHGGVESAKQVAAYAASRGVAIMPCIGTNWYQGPYYEGEHRYNLGAFLERNPDARMLNEDGTPLFISGEHGASPAHPAFKAWIAEGLQWLFDEFQIGGLNLENGDLLVDYHPLTQALREDWPAEDPEPFFFQGLCYRQALEAVRNRLAGSVVTYATYTGFASSDTLTQNANMGRRPPAMLSILPPDSIAQWTLTGMLLPEPLPLTAYLDDGAPAAAFDNPAWPKDARPPNRRSVGFLHQGSQWHEASRYSCVVGTIKEACLRAHRSGFEGVSIHGEVTSRYIPAALNYLAFSHFTHWPEDTLRDFGRKTLGQVLDGEHHGEEFATVLAHWDAGSLTAEHESQAHPDRHGFSLRMAGSACETVEQLRRYRFWEWLHQMVKARTDRHHCRTFPL